MKALIDHDVLAADVGINIPKFLPFQTVPTKCRRLSFLYC